MRDSHNLPSLTWSALGGLERAHVARGAGAGAMPSLAEWSNFLRVLDERGIDRAALPELLRLSTRAVRSGVNGATRRGWVREGLSQSSDPSGFLTARGSEVTARWIRLRESAEREWGAEIGAGKLKTLRESLETLVARLPLELPYYPAGYGAADARITGGNGRDWKAVRRKPGERVTQLPLSALLSQAWVAFAVCYERESEVALRHSAMVLGQVPPEGCRAPGLGSAGDISALLRHGFLRADDETGRFVRLTGKGRAINDAFEARVCAIEREWCDRLGDEVVLHARRALEEVSVRRSDDCANGP